MNAGWSPVRPRSVRPFPLAVRDHRVRGMLDIAMALAILSVIVATALQVYRPVPVRTAITGLDSFRTELRNSVAVDQFHTGNWAVTPGLRELVEATDYVKRLDREGSTFVLTFSGGTYPVIAGKQLAFRLARSSAGADGMLIWVCGFATPPPGYTVTGSNPTNIEQEYLPTSCREGQG